MFKAMVDVIVNKRFLCRVHRFFDGMQLLRDFQARAVCFHHFHNGAQVPICPFEPLQNFRVRLMWLMNSRFFHGKDHILVGGMWSRRYTTAAIPAMESVMLSSKGCKGEKRAQVARL